MNDRKLIEKINIYELNNHKIGHNVVSHLANS